MYSRKIDWIDYSLEKILLTGMKHDLVQIQ